MLRIKKHCHSSLLAIINAYQPMPISIRNRGFPWITINHHRLSNLKHFSPQINLAAKQGAGPDENLKGQSSTDSLLHQPWPPCGLWGVYLQWWFSTTRCTDQYCVFTPYRHFQEHWGAPRPWLSRAVIGMATPQVAGTVEHAQLWAWLPVAVIGWLQMLDLVVAVGCKRNTFITASIRTWLPSHMQHMQVCR